MAIDLAQIDLANPAAGRAYVIEPRTSGRNRRADSRIEEQIAACVPNLHYLAGAGHNAALGRSACGHFGRPLGPRHLFPFAAAHTERHDRKSIEN